MLADFVIRQIFQWVNNLLRNPASERIINLRIEELIEESAMHEIIG